MKSSKTIFIKNKKKSKESSKTKFIKNKKIKNQRYRQRQNL
jgi:hypothetical protein